MGLQAGRLRHRVTIEQRVGTQDPNTGEIVYTWTTFAASVPAAIEPLSAKEFLSAQQIQSEVTAKIIMRRHAGLVASMRITHGSDVYNIAGILADPDSGLEWVTLPVSQGLNDG